MNESSSDLYVNIDLTQKLVEDLNASRRSGESCDFSIKSKDDVIISAHKNVLKSVSPFFEKMLNSEMIECRQDFVILQKFSGELLEQIVCYMYTGKIHVSLENATEILEAALFLGLDDLVKFCTKVLINAIKEDNVWKLMEYGKIMITDLTNACYDWIMKNIAVINNSDEMKRTSIHNIRMLLQRKKHYDCCEDQYHSLILNWIESEKEARRVYAIELMDYLNFDHFSKEYLKSDKISRTKEFIDDKDFLITFFEKCAKSQNRPSVRPQLNLIECTSNESLYVITGQNIYKLDPYTEDKRKRLTKFCSLPPATNYFAVAGCENVIFLICGYHNTLKSSVYLLRCKNGNFHKENNWIKLPDLAKDFYKANALYFENKIHIYSLKNYEIFDIVNCSWSQRPELKGIKSACLLNGNFYACTDRELYRLDKEQESWECLAKFAVDYDTYGPRIIGYENYIYHFKFDGYFIYDTKNNRYFNDFQTYENDLENEQRGLVKTYLDCNSTCIYSKGDSKWIINVKAYDEPKPDTISSVSLNNDEIYFFSYEKKVKVYNASNMNFCREIPIELHKDEYFNCIVSM